MIWVAVFVVAVLVALFCAMRLLGDLVALAAMAVCAVIGGIIRLVGGDHGEARRN